MRKIILLLLLPALAFTYELSKQPLKITDDAGFPRAINDKSILELESTTKGLMWPRMTTDQKDAISDGLGGDTVLEEAMKGLFVFDTDRNKPYVWDGARWKLAGGGGAGGGGFQYLAISELNADDVKDEPGTFLTGKDAGFPNSVTGTASASPEIVKDPTLTYDSVENLQVFRWQVGAGLDETDDFVLGPEGTYPVAYLQSTHDARLRLWYWTNINPGLINFYLWCSGATQPLPMDGLANLDTDVNGNDLRDKEGAIFSADWSAIPSDCDNFRIGFKATGNIDDGGYILWDNYRLGILQDPYEEDQTKGPETNHWDFVFKYYNGNADDSVATQLESGNNLTFGVAGTLDGTFAFDDTGKVGPMRSRSFDFVSGTGVTINNWIRLRDSFYIPNYTGNVLNEIELRINFWYWKDSVAPSSISPRLECYDNGGISTGAYAPTSPLNTLPGTDTDLDGLVDTNEGDFVDVYFTVPSDGTCYSAKFGFQQTLEEDGAIFKFDRVRPGLLKAPDSINVQNNDFEVMFYYPKGRANYPSTLSSGNDVTFFNNGVLDGTFTRDYTAANQIQPNAQNSNAVFNYTAGTTLTLNNWVALEPAEIPQGYRDEDNANGRDVLVSYWYWTNFTSNNIQPSLFCVGNGTVINPTNTGNRGLLNTDYNNDLLKDADEGNRTQVSFFVPKQCGSVRFGFQQTVEEVSRFLLFDDVRIGILPRHYVDTNKIVLPTWNQIGSIGEIVAFSHNNIPADFLLADGRSLLVADYPALYAQIGCTYDCFPDKTSPTHFSIPDLRGRFIRGSIEVDNQTFTPGTVDIGTDTITLDNDTGVINSDGMKVRVSSSSTIPGGISAGTNYYVGNYNPTNSSFQLYTSRANALLGGATGLVNITSTGAGVHIISTYINPENGFSQGGQSTGGGSKAVGNLQAGATARPNADFATTTTGSHTHTYGVRNGTTGGSAVAYWNAGGATDYPTTGSAGLHNHSITGGDNETRPETLIMVYAIRHAITDYTQMLAYPVIQYEFENTYVANIDGAGNVISEGAEFITSCDGIISCTFSETFTVAPVCTANGDPATTTTTTVTFPAAATNLICHRQGTDYREIGNQASIVNAAGVPNPGSDTDAIHDNVAGEIDALTQKTVLTGADLLIIEDSEDSNNKKKVLISDLPEDSMCRGQVNNTGDILWSKCTGNYTGITLNGAGGWVTTGIAQVVVTQTNPDTNNPTCMVTPRVNVNDPIIIARTTTSTSTTCEFQFVDIANVSTDAGYNFTIYSND